MKFRKVILRIKSQNEVGAFYMSRAEAYPRVVLVDLKFNVDRKMRLCRFTTLYGNTDFLTDVSQL